MALTLESWYASPYLYKFLNSSQILSGQHRIDLRRFSPFLIQSRRSTDCYCLLRTGIPETTASSPGISASGLRARPLNGLSVAVRPNSIILPGAEDGDMVDGYGKEDIAENLGRRGRKEMEWRCWTDDDHAEGDMFRRTQFSWTSPKLIE